MITNKICAFFKLKSDFPKSFRSHPNSPLTHATIFESITSISLLESYPWMANSNQTTWRYSNYNLFHYISFLILYNSHPYPYPAVLITKYF